MNAKRLTILCSLAALSSSGAFAQAAPHPGAEKAMARIVLEKDYGDDLKFDKREVVSILENDRVPGLNGLIFMYWRGDDPNSFVMASVQWFEKKDDLIKFYRQTTKGQDFKLGEFDGTTLWKVGESGYSWTDGEHFLVSLGGNPPPPREMVKDWLAMIGNKVAEIEKEAKKKSGR